MRDSIQCDHEVTAHAIDAAEPLRIYAVDGPTHGGACHRYEIHGADINLNAAAAPGDAANFKRVLVLFQNGPVIEHGVNGVTIEALLAIGADRLRSFQAGQYPHESNAIAISHIDAALNALKARTVERRARGVEGTSKV